LLWQTISSITKYPLLVQSFSRIKDVDNFYLNQEIWNRYYYPSYSHDHFWTETWANYLSKSYFGTSWIGLKYGYPAVNISWINRLRINVARYLP